MSQSALYVVDGPPGSGLRKTTFCARQVERAVEKHGRRGVAIASFTRTAAHEIAGRVDLDDDQVGTLHSAAFRGLDSPRLAETPEGVKEWNAAHPALRLTATRRGADDAPDTDAAGHTDTDRLHAAVGAHRARLDPPETWTEAERAHHALWSDFKRQTDRLDFTDLIERAHDELPAHPAQPKVLLLDEAQDFSRLELRLALRWARQTRTTVIVGDPCQAIYTWRGAAPEDWPRIPHTGRRVLAQSFRLPRAVHAAATRWAAALGGPGFSPRDADGHAGRAPHSLGSPLLPALIEDEVFRIEEAVAAGTIDDDVSACVMILAACNYMLAPLLAELRRAGLPFHNPNAPTVGAWNPMRGTRALLAYLRPSEQAWGDEARAWTWGDVRAWMSPMQASAFTRGAKAWVEKRCEEDRFGETRAGEEADLETLIGLLGVEPADAHLHPALRLDTGWWRAHLLAARAPGAAFGLEVLDRRGPAALRARPRVQVGTIHSAKGAQAASVLLAPDLPKVAYWRGWRDGDRAPVLRQMYVGASRARERLHILAPSTVEHVGAELTGALG